MLITFYSIGVKIMKTNYAIQQLQAIMTHHVKEIARLRNSTEQYRHENIELLQKEYTSYQLELDFCLSVI
jgi:NAD(P)H-hydrate repair Nnr-like enzyme with NAD(P)H-hydrate dehydratase domain